MSDITDLKILENVLRYEREAPIRSMMYIEYQALKNALDKLRHVEKMQTTADGIPLYVGLKVWLDAHMAGVAWATINRIEFGSVLIDLGEGGEVQWTVSPANIYASEEEAIKKYRNPLDIINPRVTIPPAQWE